MVSMVSKMCMKNETGKGRLHAVKNVHGFLQREREPRILPSQRVILCTIDTKTQQDFLERNKECYLSHQKNFFFSYCFSSAQNDMRISPIYCASMHPAFAQDT